VKNQDEIGDLAHTFNDMAIEIRKLMYKQEQAAATVLETRNYLDATIAGSHDPIFVLDSEGKVEFGNSAFFEMSGYQKNEIIGKSYMILVPDEYQDFVLERWNEVHGKKYVIIAKDITELKKIDEMKDNIISNISHELRTPITIMRGFIEVAMGETDPEKRNKHLERAISAVDRQNIMIQDLIETAMGKIKNLDLVFENVDFKDILETSLKDVEPKAKLSDIKVANWMFLQNKKMDLLKSVSKIQGLEYQKKT
jgi:signal transduction histidine kinase